jgi:hypothetical protein
MGNHWGIAACVLALSGCPTVDLGDTPSDIGLCNPAKGIAYFQSDIEPKYFKLGTGVGCTKNGTACHNGAHGLTLTDATDPMATMANYRVSQNPLYMNCGQPGASELLTKPLAGVDGHGGGDIYQPGDPEVQTFLAWFQ